MHIAFVVPVLSEYTMLSVKQKKKKKPTNINLVASRMSTFEYRIVLPHKKWNQIITIQQEARQVACPFSRTHSVLSACASPDKRLLVASCNCKKSSGAMNVTVLARCSCWHPCGFVATAGVPVINRNDCTAPNDFPSLWLALHAAPSSDVLVWPLFWLRLKLCWLRHFFAQSRFVCAFALISAHVSSKLRY